MPPRFANRVEKTEQGTKPEAVLIHVFPKQSEKAAIAKHERAHGPIPKDAKVIVIRHTFTSRI
jgi:hypothetical protein